MKLSVARVMHPIPRECGVHCQCDHKDASSTRLGPLLAAILRFRCGHPSQFVCARVALDATDRVTHRSKVHTAYIIDLPPYPIDA